MKQRDALSHEFWRDELAYIEAINPTAPGSAFNYDPEVFARYCDLQGGSADRDGESDLAKVIIKIAERIRAGGTT